MENEVNTATVTGVEETEETATEQLNISGDDRAQEQDARPLSQRDAAMQSILEGRQAIIEEEYGEAIQQGEDTGAGAETGSADIDRGEEGPDEMVLKIDGQEVKVPKEKVLETGKRALQKEIAADKRLEQVSIKEQALNKRAEDLARMEKDLLTKRNQIDETIPDNVGREFADAIFNDEEKVAKTITAITRKLDAVSSVVEQAQKTDEEKRASEMQRVVNHYHTQYRDISSDPDMHFAMNRLRKEVAAANPNKSPAEVIDLAAAEVYKKFGGQQPRKVDTENTPSPATLRKQAKEKMPAPVRKASARVEPTPTPQPKKASEILNDLRKHRGPRAY